MGVARDRRLAIVSAWSRTRSRRTTSPASSSPGCRSSSSSSSSSCSGGRCSTCQGQAGAGRPRPLGADLVVGRRGPGRGEGRADRGRGVPARPQTIRAARCASAEGHPPLRAAGHRQDPDRQGRRLRVRCELLLVQRVRVRRDVRRPRRCPHPQALRGGAERTRRRSSSSTSSTRSGWRGRATA